MFKYFYLVLCILSVAQIWENVTFLFWQTCNVLSRIMWQVFVLADPCVDSGAVVIIVQQLLLVLVEEALSKLLFCVLELFWFCFASPCAAGFSSGRCSGVVRTIGVFRGLLARLWYARLGLVGNLLLWQCLGVVITYCFPLSFIVYFSIMLSIFVYFNPWERWFFGAPPIYGTFCMFRFFRFYPQAVWLLVQPVVNNISSLKKKWIMIVRC